MLAIFLDIETTGLDAKKHAAIDIGMKIIDMTTGEVKGSYQSVVKQPPEVWERKDPVSVTVNGYTWEMVSKGKDPEKVGKEIIALLTKLGVARGKAVFICQNPAFDRGFFTQLIDVYTQEKLNWPYHWLDFASMYWALLSRQTAKDGVPFPEQLNLSKNEIAKAHGLPPEVDPHRAINGVDHLILCYKTIVGIKGEE